MSQQINLFNPKFLKKTEYFSTRTILQAMGLVALGSVLLFAYAAYRVDLLTRQSEETRKLYAAEQVKLANFSNAFSPEKNNLALQEDLKRLEAQATSQKEILETLKSGAIGNTEGYSEYMRAFARQVMHGLWLNDFDIKGDGSQMSLSGGVTNPYLVPSYIATPQQRKSDERKNICRFTNATAESCCKQTPVTSYVEFSIQSTESHGAAK